MGRQFYYYCLPEDIDHIQEKVFLPLGGRLFEQITSEKNHQVQDVERFALDYPSMDKRRLHLYLAPPKDLDHVVFLSPGIIDVSNSNLIEVGRCYTDGHVIRRSRFWYDPKAFLEGEFTDKPKEFIKWAQTVFAQTKKLLRYEVVLEKGEHSKYTYKDWFGEIAWEAVSSGKLVAPLN